MDRTYTTAQTQLQLQSHSKCVQGSPASVASSKRRSRVHAPGSSATAREAAAAKTAQPTLVSILQDLRPRALGKGAYGAVTRRVALFRNGTSSPTTAVSLDSTATYPATYPTTYSECVALKSFLPPKGSGGIETLPPEFMRELFVATTVPPHPNVMPLVAAGVLHPSETSPSADVSAPGESEVACATEAEAEAEAAAAWGVASFAAEARARARVRVESDETPRTFFVAMPIAFTDAHNFFAARAIPPHVLFNALFTWGHMLCAGIAHLHAHGVIHRDIKLANLLIAADGTARLSDMGMSRPMPSLLNSKHVRKGVASEVFVGETAAAKEREKDKEREREKAKAKAVEVVAASTQACLYVRVPASATASASVSAFARVAAASGILSPLPVETPAVAALMPASQQTSPSSSSLHQLRRTGSLKRRSEHSVEDVQHQQQQQQHQQQEEEDERKESACDPPACPRLRHPHEAEDMSAYVTTLWARAPELFYSEQLIASKAPAVFDAALRRDPSSFSSSSFSAAGVPAAPEESPPRLPFDGTLSRYSAACDVWSVGVSLLCLAQRGEFPVRGKTEEGMLAGWQKTLLFGPDGSPTPQRLISLLERSVFAASRIHPDFVKCKLHRLDTEYPPDTWERWAHRTDKHEHKHEHNHKHNHTHQSAQATQMPANPRQSISTADPTTATATVTATIATATVTASATTAVATSDSSAGDLFMTDDEALVLDCEDTEACAEDPCAALLERLDRCHLSSTTRVSLAPAPCEVCGGSRVLSYHLPSSRRSAPSFSFSECAPTSHVAARVSPLSSSSPRQDSCMHERLRTATKILRRSRDVQTMSDSSPEFDIQAATARAVAAAAAATATADEDDSMSDTDMTSQSEGDSDDSDSAVSFSDASPLKRSATTVEACATCSTTCAALVHVLFWCLQRDPERRCTASWLRAHPVWTRWSASKSAGSATMAMTAAPVDASLTSSPEYIKFLSTLSRHMHARAPADATIELLWPSENSPAASPCIPSPIVTCSETACSSSSAHDPHLAQETIRYTEALHFIAATRGRFVSSASPDTQALVAAYKHCAHEAALHTLRVLQRAAASAIQGQKHGMTNLFFFDRCRRPRSLRGRTASTSLWGVRSSLTVAQKLRSIAVLACVTQLRCKESPDMCALAAAAGFDPTLVFEEMLDVLYVLSSAGAEIFCS